MFKSIAVAALFACGLSGCGQLINPGPDYAVEYAIDRISPAVVRLDVVVNDFDNGQPTSGHFIGSGTIIDKEGRILTNFHVAGRANDIKITLANKEQVKATLVGSDHWTDLALVQMDMAEIKKKNVTFSFATLGDSSKVVLGQPVLAMGTPYGLTRTLTKGIISNTEREIDPTRIEGEYETGSFNNWLQMDAAINPGNSGGPLMNLRGEIIGINTRGASGANNLGFAIPSNVAKEVIAVLLKEKNVTYSYIGVGLRPLQDFEKHYNLPPDRGVLVESIDQFSPAAAAGIQDSDILLAINDKPVAARFQEEMAGVEKQIASFPVGSNLKLSIQRKVGDQFKIIELTCKTEKLESAVTQEKSIPAWGITVRELTRAYLRANRMTLVEGILVTGVKSTSLAATAKIANGEVITAVDHKPVRTIAELEASVAAWAAGDKAIGIDTKYGREDHTRVLKAKEAPKTNPG